MDRQKTAFHEAGHAAAYLHYDIKFRSVAVFRAPQDGCTGHLIVMPYWASRAVRAALCLAGPVAEARFTGRPVGELLAGPEGLADLGMAQEALARGGRLGLDAALDATHALVAEEWPRIERLACRLLARECLTYAEVIIFWSATGRASPHWEQNREVPRPLP